MQIKILPAIGNRRLIDELTQRGVEFTGEDITDAQAYIAALSGTNATHAVFGEDISIGYGLKRFLKCLRGENDTIPAILLARAQPTQQEIKLYEKYNIQIVTDNSRTVPDTIMGLLKPPEQPPTEKESSIEQDANAEPGVSCFLEEEAVIELPKEPVSSPSQVSPPELAPRTKPRLGILPQRSAPVKSKEDVPRTVLRPMRQLSPFVIAVFTGNRGAGGTWLSVQIARYIADFNLRVCLLTQEEGVSGQAGNADCYTQASVAEVMLKGYTYIVLDAGTMFHLDADGLLSPASAVKDMSEIVRAGVRILVCDLNWKDAVPVQLCQDEVWRPAMEHCSVVCSCRTDARSAAEASKQIKRQLLCLPMCTIDETTPALISVLEDILHSILERQKEDQKKA